VIISLFRGNYLLKSREKVKATFCRVEALLTFNQCPLVCWCGIQDWHPTHWWRASMKSRRMSTLTGSSIV
jgi:hypothetical protein